MSSPLLTCLGVGDGWPCATRHHSSFLYRIGDAVLLIDAGDGTSQGFKASGLPYDLVDALLISHLHFDHVGGLFMLMQGFWLEKRRKPLPIHLPGDGIEPIRSLLRAGCVFDELLRFDLTYQALDAEEAIDVCGVRIRAFPTTHLSSLKRRFETIHPQRYEAFSFLLEADSVRVGHSADIGTPADLDPLVGEPLDLLVCELAHFAPETLFEYLAPRDVRKVVLTHLTASDWTERDRVQAMAAEMLPGKDVVIANDGLTLSL